MRLLTAMIVSSCLLAAAAAAQDDGQLAYNSHCQMCHTLDPGDDRLGPTFTA